METSKETQEVVMTEEQVLRRHSEFNQALIDQDYDGLAQIYADAYMLVRPDGSVLNKQQVLKDLREKGLKFLNIELKEVVARMFDAIGVVTAESKSRSSRSGEEFEAHFRLVAIYVEEAGAIRLVHFQSTTLS
jgi:hypothetical protein